MTCITSFCKCNIHKSNRATEVPSLFCVTKCVEVCGYVFHKSKINSPSLSGTILLSLSSFSLMVRFCHTGVVADFWSCSDLTLGCPGPRSFMPTAPGCFFFVCFTFGFDPVGFTFGVILVLAILHSMFDLYSLASGCKMFEFLKV